MTIREEAKEVEVTEKSVWVNWWNNEMCQQVVVFDETATTDTYTEQTVGSVRCVQKTDHNLAGGDVDFFANHTCDTTQLRRRETGLLYTSPSPRDRTRIRMPSSA